MTGWELTALEYAALRAVPAFGIADHSLCGHVAASEGVSRQAVQLAVEKLHRHGALIRADGHTYRTERGATAARSKA